MTPAGWYYDGSGQLRWWDGTQWTEHVTDAPQAQSAPTTVAPAATAPAAAAASTAAIAPVATEPAAEGGASPRAANSTPAEPEAFVPPYAMAAQPLTASAPAPAPGYPAAGYAMAPAAPPARKVSVLGLIGLGAAVVGVVLACIPPIAVAGWVVLGAAFVLSLVSLFLRGAKWPGITGIGVTLLGAILAAAVALLSLGLDSGTEAVGVPVVVPSERPPADDETAEAPSEDPSEIEGAEMVTIAELEVGDCMPLVEYEDEVYELPVVACDQPHTDEVYFIYEAEDGEFPGDDALSEDAWTRCVAEFETFIGIPYEDSEFDVYNYQPTEASWKRWDDREIQCIVYSFEDVTGTLEGSAR